MGLVIDLACEEVNFFSRGSIGWGGGGGGESPQTSQSHPSPIFAFCVQNAIIEVNL